MPKYAHKTFGGSPIAKMCIFKESKMPILRSKMPNFAHKNGFAPNGLKSHLWVSHEQNLYIWGVKNAKIWKIDFAPNAPKWLLGVFHDQNLDIWGSKMPILGVKNVKIWRRKLFCSKLPHKSFEGFRWLKCAKFAYWGCVQKSPFYHSLICTVDCVL